MQRSRESDGLAGLRAVEGGNQGGQAGNALVSQVAGEGKSGCSEGELRD